MRTDESHFWIVTLNRRTACTGHTIIPMIWLHLDEWKVTVWCGITRTFILCPDFFEEVTAAGLQNVHVKNARYLEMLTNCVIPILQQWNALADAVWIEYGTPPYGWSSVKCFLIQQFSEIFISCHFTFTWPSRFPYLIPMALRLRV